MEEKRPSFAIFVVWSAMFGQLTDNYSRGFSLIHPVDEFSFKAMRT